MSTEGVRDPILGRRSVLAIDGVSVDADTAGRITLIAQHDLIELSTGRFARPRVGVRWTQDEWPSDVEFLGCAFTQFALPVTAGRDLDFGFAPAPGLRSPRAVSPLVARVGDGVVLLAPVDHPHEQIIAVADGSLVWGWHGDLDRVPAGFSTSLGVYAASSVIDALAAWRAELDVVERSTSDPVTTHLSYWTDNGAAYWYRTEADVTIAESIESVVASLRAADVPVRSVELDSWFYDHATPRSITEIGYPQEVPPSGAVRWSPRADAFPVADDPVPDDADPMETLQNRLGSPLVLHARHIAPESPYIDDPTRWWVDGSAAHPRDQGFFRRWFVDAARWGATCIEQDWMLMYWFGVRELRAVPGRAADWQRALNEHADATGLSLIWCMATPADLMLAATLDRVVAVRTCDDYRFADDPAFLWTWFLTVNRLTNTLGLTAFKDCFFSRPDVIEGDDPIDGDRHAELEALLAALSGGPVGIGDRIGRTDRDVVMRACDVDGRLRRVDRALAATDDCLFGGPERGDGLMWATTTSTDADGLVWTYVVGINTASEPLTIADRFELVGERKVFTWRDGTTHSCVSIETELDPRDWALWVVAPAEGGDVHAAGDPTKYVVIESAIG